MSEPDSPSPRLSVVIPTLGRPTLIPTVGSVLRSCGSLDTEIWVVGDIADPDTAHRFAALRAENARLLHVPVSYPRGDSSEKKNAGWRAARADIVAFLDDDVVVAPDWPERILEAFADEGVALVSGPGLVPPDAALFPRLAGLTLSSPAAGYVAWRYRHGTGELIPVKWSKIIGCNMAYRKRILEEIGGFDPAFWPGEEMIASWRTEQAGHSLKFYSPAYVYHYPRQSLGRFWKQIFGYGATRIRLLRAGVEFEPTTMAPALWVAALTVGIIGSFFAVGFAYYLAVLLISYLLADAVITAVMVRESKQAKDLLVFLLIPVLHLSYGLGGWYECLRPNRDLSMRSQAK